MTEITEIIQSFNEYLGKLPKGSLIIAEGIRLGKTEETLVDIQYFSEGVIWLSEVSTLLKANGYEVEFNLDKISVFLKEINEGLEIQDYNLVADLFEYEIAPFFDNISNTINFHN